ncbi:hypothetical protein ACFV9E_01445 [Streptomyces sp. NPDC059835]|uniref:hypothetical protein n=1 Tax=Streptomyces sp. NPDC059835 TaxID=3346967 RepID=UPI003663195D
MLLEGLGPDRQTEGVYRLMPTNHRRGVGGAARCRPGTRRAGSDSPQQELLRLLGGGLTDAAAGNRLGISPRTVRRMMAELTERLDAQSRFVAGLRAGLRAGRRGRL